MRTGGTGRWFVIAVALFLALCAPVTALRFIGFFISFLLLSALLYNRFIRTALSVNRIDREVRGMRLQRLESRISLHNRFALPAARVIVSEATGSLHCDNSTQEVMLPAYGTIEISFALWGDRRGEYRCGPVRLRGSDPLALFQWQREERTSIRAVVYPRIYPLELTDALGVAGGSLPTANPAYEDITRFRSVREYTGGDELKRINWKVSAKTGRLYTTEYEHTFTAPVRIVLDLMSEDYPSRRRDQLCERAIEVAAALVFSYARRGQPVGLVAAAGEVDERVYGPLAEAAGSEVICGEDAGWSHAERLLEILARIRQAAGTADYLRLLSGPGRETSSAVRILVIGPEATDIQVGQLRALRAAHARAEMFEIRAGDAPPSRRALASVLPVHPVRDFGEELLER